MKTFSIPKTFIFLFYLLPFHLAAQTAIEALDNFKTDGRINAMAYDEVNNKLFFGGDFTKVGQQANGSAMDLVNGNSTSGYPELNNYIFASVSDGAGGFYLGGSFTSPVPRLAHIDASGAITSFNILPNNTVTSLAQSGGYLYVGGVFTAIDGVARNRIARINLATEEVDANWNPNPDNSISEILVSGNTIYVSGTFTSIGGETRNRIAALNNTTGAALSTFQPAITGAVSSMVISGSSLYVGGSFTEIGGVSRNNLALLNATNGALQAWNPSPSSAVYELLLDGTSLYVGGNYSSIAGVSQLYISKFNTVNGTMVTWNPTLSDFRVYCMAISGSTLYVGGHGGIAASTKAQVTALHTTTAAPTNWNPSVVGQISKVNTMAISGSSIYVGGKFDGIGGINRDRLAAVDLSDYSLDSWSPSANGNVSDLLLVDNELFVAGEFTDLDKMAYLAKLSTSTGAALSWDAQANEAVQVISVSGDQLFVGGEFTVIGKENRNYAAALDINTALANTWNPNPDAEVNVLAIYKSFVYLGGYFTAVNGNNRAYVAKVDFEGVLTNWVPEPDNLVKTIVINEEGAVFLGGPFSNIGGISQPYLAKYKPESATIDNEWSPVINSSVNAITFSNNGKNLYISGDFTHINGTYRKRHGAVSQADGSTVSWNPTDGEYSGQKLELGGLSIYGAYHRTFSAINGTGYFGGLYGHTRIQDSPLAVELDNSSVDENKKNGRVGSFSTSDDNGDTHEYQLVKGSDDTNNTDFSIVNSSLYVRGAFDYELGRSKSIRVSSTDNSGNVLEESFTINVNNVIETAHDIMSFSLPEQTTNAVISKINHTVTIHVAPGTDLSALTPNLTVSSGASSSPNTGDARDFSTPVNYTVQAENGTTQIWTVSILSLYIWNGSAWNHTEPGATDRVQIDGDYDTNDDGNLVALDLTINTGVNVNIAPNTSIHIAGNLNHQGDSFMVESSGTLVTEGDVAGTNFTFERITTFNEATGRYSIVGSPVADQSFSTLGGAALVYGYDETVAYALGVNDGLNRFKTPAQLSQTELQMGQGYFSANTGDTNGKITFSGMPFHGNQSIALTRTDHPTEEDAFEGFNLVSNPYPAAINFDIFIQDNISAIEGAIYLWDDFDSESNRGTNNDYLVVNDIGYVDSRKSGYSKWDENIGSMQGFFVQAKIGGSLQLNFNDDMKVAANNTDGSYFRSANTNTSFKLVLENETGGYSETLVGLREDAKAGIDRNDAVLLSRSGTKIYTMLADQPHAIQNLPFDGSLMIPIGMNCEQTGEFSIRLDEDQHLDGHRVMLIDQTLNTRTLLSNGIKYRFDASTGLHHGRFSINIENQILSADDQIKTYHWTVYQSSQGELTVSTDSNDKIQAIEVISLSGRTERLDFSQKSNKEWTGNTLNKGMYLIKICSSKSTEIHRIILK